MARIRTIKPGFWTDEKLSQMPALVRMTFLGLISAMADDAGRCKGDVRLVKAAVWPLDDEMTSAVVAEHLAKIADAGRIQVYVVDGARYIQIVNWKKHQRIDKPRPSELPEPPEPSPTTPRPFDDDSKNDHGSVVDRSDREAEAERSGKGFGSGAGSGSGESAPPAPLLRAAGFTPGVIAFVDLYYPDANERRADVVAQLRATVDAGPGALLSRDSYVRARSIEHLEETCLALIAKPPIHRDKAIVILLMRLGDAPKGPTPSEQHKAAESARLQLEDAYQRELESFAARWAKENTGEYQRIVDEVSLMFRGAVDSGFVRSARDSALSQKCAERGGFPDFETWHVKRRGAA